MQIQNLTSLIKIESLIKRETSYLVFILLLKSKNRIKIGKSVYKMSYSIEKIYPKTDFRTGFLEPI